MGVGGEGCGGHGDLVKTLASSLDFTNTHGGFVGSVQVPSRRRRSSISRVVSAVRKQRSERRKREFG